MKQKEETRNLCVLIILLLLVGNLTAASVWVEPPTMDFSTVAETTEYGVAGTRSDNATTPSDLDGDGLSDSEEEILGTNRSDPDTDADGLTDGLEVNELGTDPLNIDTDRDGLSDSFEARVVGTDPTKPDTDEDGLTDSWELDHGSDPLDPESPANEVSEEEEPTTDSPPEDNNAENENGPEESPTESDETNQPELYSVELDTDITRLHLYYQVDQNGNPLTNPEGRWIFVLKNNGKSIGTDGKTALCIELEILQGTHLQFSDFELGSESTTTYAIKATGEIRNVFEFNSARFGEVGFLATDTSITTARFAIEVYVVNRETETRVDLITNTDISFDVIAESSEEADTDGDGAPDDIDIWPNDPTQWMDSDGDQHGDNPLGTNGDLFANDPYEWFDTDGDGVGDNSDRFPNDGARWKIKGDDDDRDDSDEANRDANNDSPQIQNEKGSEPSTWFWITIIATLVLIMIIGAGIILAYINAHRKAIEQTSMQINNRRKKRPGDPSY